MSTEIGKRAEQVAADFLTQQKYRVLERNWRTRWCEIDIIASKGTVIYFVEVKYRHNLNQGSGLDYITDKKLTQMHFAAQFWLSRNECAVADYRLSAMELSGDSFKVTAWLDDIT